MLNHFSSLLVNLNTEEVEPSVANYFLGTDLQELLATENNELIILEDIKTFINLIKYYDVLINKDYIKLNLPSELSNFYDLIFPPTASRYYKQFLLYSYLRLINSTSVANEIFNFDSRISYNLEEIDIYFRLFKKSTIFSNEDSFKLSSLGNFILNETAAGPVQNFLIKQKENLDEVYVFSLTDGKYYKEGIAPSSNSLDMENKISFSDNSFKVSKPVVIGDTGLSFIFTSVDSLSEFTTSANKLWTFSVDTPLSFNYIDKIKELIAADYVVETMLNFNKSLCTSAYENLWRFHFNDIYKLAGLLLSYVERVNLIWQAKAT